MASFVVGVVDFRQLRIRLLLNYLHALDESRDLLAHQLAVFSWRLQFRFDSLDRIEKKLGDAHPSAPNCSSYSPAKSPRHGERAIATAGRSRTYNAGFAGRSRVQLTFPEWG